MQTRSLSKIVMSPSVEVLNWKIEAFVGAQLLTSVCDSIIDRLPNIRTMSIDFARNPQVETQLMGLFSRMSKLERVILPLYGLSPSLLYGLSHSNTLTTIGILGNIVPCSNEFPVPGDEAEFLGPTVFEYPKCAFGALSSLSFWTPSLAIASSLLRSTEFPLHNMGILFLRIPNVMATKGIDVQHFLESVSAHAVELVELTLWLTPAEQVHQERYSPSVKVGLCGLLPISDFPSLRKFVIHHSSALDLTDVEYRRLAQRLPKIETLILNPSPTVLGHTSVPINILCGFAEFCPLLREVGVYVDCTRVVDPHVGAVFGANFRTLDLGRSRLPFHWMDNAYASTATYLAGILQSSVLVRAAVNEVQMDTLNYMLTSDGRTLSYPASTSEASNSAWDMVKYMMRSIWENQRLRTIERARILRKLESLRDEVLRLHQTKRTGF